MVEFEEIKEEAAAPAVPRSQERLLDAEELEKVAPTLTRPTARMQVEALAKKLRKESEALKRVEASQSQNDVSSEEKKVVDSSDATATATTTAAPTPTPTPPPAVVRTPAAPPTISSSAHYVPIDKFAFDAGGYNSAFLTLYIDLPGVGSIDKDLITCHFTTGSFDLIVKDLKGKSYRLFKDNLANDIDPEASKLKIKSDKILVKLGKKKSEYGSYDHWSELTAKTKRDANKKDNPSAGIMDMMKDMYNSGDDKMRKVIGETMMKQRNGELDKMNPGDMNMDMGGM